MTSIEFTRLGGLDGGRRVGSLNASQTKGPVEQFYEGQKYLLM